jgi:hypothetical protein
MKTKRITARAYLGERGHTGFKRCRTVAGRAVTDAEIEPSTELIRMTDGKVEFVRWTPHAAAQLWDVWTNAMLAEEEFSIWTKRLPGGYGWTLKAHPTDGDFHAARTLHAALAAGIAANHKEKGNQ